MLLHLLLQLSRFLPGQPFVYKAPGDGVNYPDMKTYVDCMPCFIKQALTTVRLATADEDLQQRVVREILTEISAMDLTAPPPVMAAGMHRRIREATRRDDPYKDLKQHYNRFALAAYPRLKTLVETSEWPLETAVRLAIAGNIIDFGVNLGVNPVMVDDTVEQSLTVSLFGEISPFAEALSGAEKILYLADNAGEIVFDRLLIEEIGPERVTLAVRGSPVINDATMEDARFVGLTDIVAVIDNGSDIPGTVPPVCSDSFVRTFEQADMIISKGQGNYETLSETVAGGDMFFLFQTKCGVAARDIGCGTGCFVIKKKL